MHTAKFKSWGYSLFMIAVIPRTMIYRVDANQINEIISHAANY